MDAAGHAWPERPGRCERQPRILAAIIVPPHLTVSGGARAAEQLSAALASRCDITVASMMNGAGSGAAATMPAPHRSPVRSALPPLLPWSWLPNRFATLFYRSDIPRLIAPGIDLVHLHNPMPALELARIASACRAGGLPYVVSTHGFNEVWNGEAIYGFDGPKRLAWRRLVVEPVSRAVRGADAVFVLSPADIDIVRGMGFAGDILQVHNGVDLPVLAAPEGDAALLQRLGVPERDDPNRIHCMFLANHTPNKGLPDLLKAFGQLDVPYTLVVGGERRDAIDYESHLRACRPGQRIIVTGRLTDPEVAALYRQSDLFVFPTLADTFPLVVLEAMAHGVAVLASAVGGIPHQITEDCGVLVPPGDPAALAAAVARLAAEPGLLERMGCNARARVAAEFSWERAADQALAGYRQVLRRRPTPAA
ncbi:glycosyltransferase [Roseomonas frigidaquae]|uniref:Glycosyltransferase n=1 Tax=Falsiroseomonas frigidaquae TaxID=487318 RepID=A0ABX1EU42_9PROT|nr:glycosyltransferase [Falsiroseomonas frigidaquae]NKE44140.1 glycosyltransferase [Falsiroseomonas frigidaquae]